MLNGREFLLVIQVLLAYSMIRMLPRFLAGFKAYLSPAQVKRAMENGESVCLLDVRTPAEFARVPGHIPGALNVPLTELKARMAHNHALQANHDALVITVCRSDARAAFPTWVLRRHGFARPRVMSGGKSAWMEDGLSLTGDTASVEDISQN